MPDDLIDCLRRANEDPMTRTDMASTSCPSHHAPVNSALLAAEEARLGFDLPESLRRLYRDVGNGGFGPGYGLYGLKGGHADEGRTLVETYEMFVSDSSWPRELVPIVDWGCATWSCIDRSSAAAMIVNATSPTIAETDQPLDNWLRAWLDGAPLEEDMFEPSTQSATSRNPFTGAPMILLSRGLLRGRRRPWSPELSSSERTMSDELDVNATLRLLPGDPSGWPDLIHAMPSADAARVVRALRDAWIDNHLAPSVWASVTGRKLDRTLVDREIGAVFAALDRRGIAPVPQWLERGASSETDVRRWCGITEWLLMSQDEDLLLMSDEWMVPLLEEASADCTKRTYALGIVAHHTRDSAHHALWDGAPSLVTTLGRFGDWLPAARQARAPELVAYLERLAGYARPTRVTEADARRRVLDLRRCASRDEIDPDLVRRGDEWVARFDRGNAIASDLRIHAGSGKMRGREHEKKRR